MEDVGEALGDGAIELKENTTEEESEAVVDEAAVLDEDISDEIAMLDEDISDETAALDEDTLDETAALDNEAAVLEEDIADPANILEERTEAVLDNETMMLDEDISDEATMLDDEMAVLDIETTLLGRDIAANVPEDETAALEDTPEASDEGLEAVDNTRGNPEEETEITGTLEGEMEVLDDPEDIVTAVTEALEEEELITEATELLRLAVGEELIVGIVGVVVVVERREVVGVIMGVVMTGGLVGGITALLVVAGGGGRVSPKICNRNAKRVIMPKRRCLKMSDNNENEKDGD
jgi:hypothetical protein